MSNILIAGSGYIGTALGSLLAGEGHTVWGLRRSTGQLPDSIQPFSADLTDRASLEDLPASLDFVAYTAAADDSSDEAYRSAYVVGLTNLLDALQAQGHQPARILFTSSTSVYAQSSGEWVDETSPVEPANHTGKRMLEAEEILRASGFASTILRLGGIYGSSRTRLIDKVKRGGPIPKNAPPIFTNRIHCHDAAGALHHLMNLGEPDRIYLGVDHEPASPSEVMEWLAAQLGIEVQKEACPLEQTRRHQSNKRCRNARLVGSGYQFTYPTYREGYAAILDECS